MLDAQELSPHSFIVYIVELESTAAAIVKMLESDVQVVCDAIIGFAKLQLLYLDFVSSSSKLH